MLPFLLPLVHSNFELMTAGPVWQLYWVILPQHFYWSSLCESRASMRTEKKNQIKSNPIHLALILRTGLLPKPSSLFFANISCHNLGQIGYECLSSLFQTGSSKMHAIQYKWGRQGRGTGKVDWWWGGGAMTNKTAKKKRKKKVAFVQKNMICNAVKHWCNSSAIPKKIFRTGTFGFDVQWLLFGDCTFFPSHELNV